MNRALAVATILVVSLSVSGSAQISPPSKKSTIYVGMELRLGMSRDEIVTNLTKSYTVEKMESDGDEWFVAEKQHPEIWQGHLGFHEKKLTYASRAWTQGGEDTFEFGQALWRVISEFQRAGNDSCMVDTPMTNSSTAEIRYIRLYCGGKRIEVMMTDVFNGTGKGHHADITEVLSSEKMR
jgi:hypothetical protein